MTRTSWDVIFNKPAVEFLNILAFAKDRAEWEKEKMDEWKRRH